MSKVRNTLFDTSDKEDNNPQPSNDNSQPNYIPSPPPNLKTSQEARSKDFNKRLSIFKQSQEFLNNSIHSTAFTSLYKSFYEFVAYADDVAAKLQELRDFENLNLPQIFLSSLDTQINFFKTDKIENVFPKPKKVVNEAFSNIKYYFDSIRNIYRRTVNPQYNKAFFNQTLLCILGILYHERNILFSFKYFANLNIYYSALNKNLKEINSSSNLSAQTKEAIVDAQDQLVDLINRISMLGKIINEIVGVFNKKSITIHMKEDEKIQKLIYDFASDLTQLILEKPLHDLEYYLLLMEYKFFHPLETLILHYKLIDGINQSHTHRIEMVTQLKEELDNIHSLYTLNEEDKLELMRNIIEEYIKTINDSLYLIYPSYLKNELSAFLNQITISLETIKERNNKLHNELIDSLNQYEKWERRGPDPIIEKLRNDLITIHGYSKLTEQEHLSVMKRTLNNCIITLLLKDKNERKELYPDLKKKLNDCITEIDKILNITDMAKNMTDNMTNTNTIKMKEEEKTYPIEKENNCNLSRPRFC